MSRIRANSITNKNANGAPDFPNGLTVTGVVTATVSNSTLGSLTVSGDATIGGNLGVAGTVTYEDVARVDATGISTFREGFKLGPLAGIALTAYKDGSIRTSGIVTAASFVGDGSGLTNAGPTLTNGVNNRVITASSATAIQGESKLTFDGNTLDIDNGNIGLKIGGNVNSSGRSDNTYKIARLVTPHYHNAEEPMAIMQVASDGTDNIISHGGSWNGANAATQHSFYTAANDATHTGSERFRIGSAGQLGIGGATYGTSGQVLKSAGNAAPPTWGAADGWAEHVYFNKDGDLANCSTNTWAKVAFDAGYHRGTSTGQFSDANDRYTPGVAGWYLIHAAVVCHSNGSNTWWHIEVRKNNSGQSVGHSIYPYQTNGTKFHLGCTGIIDLDADDYVEVFVNQSTGGTRGVDDKTITVVRVGTNS